MLSPAVAAFDGLRRGPAAACSRRPSQPSTGLGAGRLRPALAGRRRPRQACAGGELLSRTALAVGSRLFVAVCLWCNLRLLNEYSGSQAASGPGQLGLSHLRAPKG